MSKSPKQKKSVESQSDSKSARLNKKFYFIGSGLFSSFQFIHPLKFIQKFLKIGAKSKTRTAREEKGSPFDQYLGYALVLVGSK